MASERAPLCQGCERALSGPVYRAICHHTYHLRCIYDWLFVTEDTHSLDCPYCEHVITEDVDEKSLKKGIKEMRSYVHKLDPQLACCSLCQCKDIQEAWFCSTHGLVHNLSGKECILCSKDASGTLELFIKTLKGNTILVKINPKAYVWQLKMLIYKKEKIVPCTQVLLHAAKRLLSGLKLANYGIKKHSTIHMIHDLKGS